MQLILRFWEYFMHRSAFYGYLCNCRNASRSTFIFRDMLSRPVLYKFSVWCATVLRNIPRYLIEPGLISHHFMALQLWISKSTHWTSKCNLIIYTWTTTNKYMKNVSRKFRHSSFSSALVWMAREVCILKGKHQRWRMIRAAGNTSCRKSVKS